MDIKLTYGILKINLKHNLIPHLFLAIVIVCFTLVIFGISSLDELESAKPLEMLLSLTGIILLTPIFLPEQNENIRDLIRSKRTDYLMVCLIRLVYSLFFLAVIFGIFIIIMAHSESMVTLQHFIGGYSSALFLGTLGFFSAGVSGNSIIGYMVSMIYYIANFAMKKELKNLYLFSMSSGSFHEKYWLLGCSLVLIMITFLCLKFSRK